MKYLLLSIVLILAASLSAFAQETPKMEYSAGYTYLRAADHNYDGFDTSMAYNLSKSFAAVFDFSGFYARENAFGPIATGTLLPGQTLFRSSAPDTIYTFMVGPRFSFNKNGRFTPFAETLIGLDRIDQKNKTVAGTDNGNIILNDSHNSFVSFSSKIGGGIDIKAARHISIRAVEADYIFLNNLKDASGLSGQNGLRVSCGLNFRF